MKIGIVTLAFGMPATIEANKLLAKITEEYAQKYELPIFSQNYINFSKEFEVTKIKEAKNEPAPTLRIARAAITWARENDLKVLLIIAAPLHTWRIQRDFQEAIKEVNSKIDVCISKEVEQYPPHVWICKDSEQIHTRYKIAWQTREFIIKIMPFWFYNAIAS